MLPQVLTTKLKAPQIHGGIAPRPHLTARLHAGLDRKLTLICAPAGFGKTTLLSAWLAEYEPNVAWLSLDRTDNTPVRFFETLIAAFQTVHPGSGESARVALHSTHASPCQPLLVSLINEIVALPRPFVLVLDGYHLITNKTVHEGITFLLDNLPKQLHLIILSRSEPPLPLAHLRLRDQVNEFRTRDLRFNYDETLYFLNRVSGCDLSGEQIAALQTCTEGWIGGLHSAAISLRGLDAAQQQHFLTDFNRGSRHVADYLLEEVFNQQPEPLRNFLLQISILERFNSSLCQAVTGEANTQRFLEQMEMQNLFVTSLDAHRDWYRYHHLFAKVLSQRLHQTQHERIPELHRRASAWYEQQGWVSEAIQHALTGQDWERVTRLMATTAEVTTLKSQCELVCGRKEKLPDESCRSNSFPCLSCVATNEQVLALLPGDYTAHNDISALTVCKLYLRDGQTAKADQILARIDLARPEFMNDDARLALITTLGELRLQQGKLHLAAATCEPFIDLMTTQSSELLRFNFQLGLCRLYYEWDELTKAEQVLRQSLAKAEQSQPIPTWSCEGYLALANIEEAKGKDKAADAASHQAIAVAQLSNDPALIALAKAHQVQQRLKRGELSAPARWLHECGLSPKDPVPYWRQSEYLTLVRVLMSQRQPDQAILVLERLLEDAEIAGRGSDAIKILVLKALAYEAKGEPEHAFAAVANALCQAEREGYVRTFVDEGAPMARLLQRAAERGLTLVYVRRLLDAFAHLQYRSLAPSDRIGDSIRGIDSLIEPLSERELEVLRLVAAGNSNRETAVVLCISPTTVKKHLDNILGKLGTKNRTQAAAKARQLRLIQ